MNGGVAVLVEARLADVVQRVLELVVEPVERDAGGAAVERDLVLLLLHLGAGEDAAGRDPGLGKGGSSAHEKGSGSSLHGGWRLFAAVNSPRLRFPVVVSLCGAHLLGGGLFASGVSDAA